MFISILSSVAFHSSSAVDPALTLAAYIAHRTGTLSFNQGLEIQSGTEIYEYRDDTQLDIPVFSTQADYSVGDLVVHHNALYKITGKEGEPAHTLTRPMEPDEYAGWDENPDFNNWTHRYFRIPNNAVDGWASKMWTYNHRWYYLFWEGRGYGGCATGGWRFSAKDLNRTDAQNRHANWYKRSCLRSSYSTAYDAAKDICADIELFAAPGMPKLPTLNFHSMINRNGYFYFRTHLSDEQAPLEYTSHTVAGTVQYALTPVTTPMDIPGFIYKRKTLPATVFDGKNYTKCVQYPEDATVTFSFTNTEDFDAIALGRVIAETVDISVTTMDGVSVQEIKNYPLDNIVLDRYFSEAFTPVLYMPHIIQGEHLITVTLHGHYVEIGDIVVGLTIDAGFTNLEFDNDFKDFSPNEQDQWGNIYYVDGVRVHRHSGTVDVPLAEYDKITRMIRMIGGNEVIVNGSDSRSNAPTNSKTIFQSTMFIARFKSLKQKTRKKGNRLANTATYSFVLEERV